MIGALRGVIAHKSAPALLLDVQGVGYEVEAPMSTFYVLPAVGSEVLLHTHLVVREDAQLLYGFASPTERALFRALIKVNGVGAKLALAILSGITVDDFALCVHDADASRLTKLPGIGKKTAERLIVEMRDRLPDGADFAVSAIAGGDRAVPPLPVSAESDAISALVSLGFNRTEAGRMVDRIDTASLPSEEIIRQALQATVK